MNIQDNLKHNIIETFGPGKYCLGKDWRINFVDKELKKFIINLPEEKVTFLNRLILFFFCHMRPLYSLENTSDELNKVLGKTVWSTFSLITIMSVLDRYTKGYKYKREKFLDFLSKRIPIEDKENLKAISEEYKKNNPAPYIKRLCDLFKNNLEDKEINIIKESYLREDRNNGKINKSINSFEDVIEHLWGEVRSGFIHDISIDSIYNESIIFSIDEKKPNVIKVIDNLSMSNFLYLSWKTVFRDMGYEGDINPNFTKEEQEKGYTVEGTKIRF